MPNELQPGQRVNSGAQKMAPESVAVGFSQDNV